MKRVYKGIVEWHTEPPKKTGIYLVTFGDGNVLEMKYYKDGSKYVWETYDESEDGGFIRYDVGVKAWAYLPEPYNG